MQRSAYLSVALLVLLAVPQVGAQVDIYGHGCPMGNGLVPTIGVGVAPLAFQPFSIEIDLQDPLAGGFLVFGLTDTSWMGIPLPAQVPDFPPGCLLYPSVDFLVSIFPEPTGKVSFDLPGIFPAGFTFWVQAFGLSNASWGVSRPMKVTVTEPASDFTLALMPDTQHYSDDILNHANFTAQTSWIVSNLATESIAFVSHVGDIVHNPNVIDEWNRADAAMATLDGDLLLQPDGLVPYGAVCGNHDYDVVNNKSSASNYISYFGPGRYTGRSWFAGASADQVNMAQVFSVDGQEFLHLALEWRPSDVALEWAQETIGAHPDLPTIVTTHEHLDNGTPAAYSLTGATPNSAGNNEGLMVHRKLVEPFPQIFLVLCGHDFDNGRRTSTTALGQQVHEILADYQADPNGGNGWMRLFRMRAGLSEIESDTFSPTYVPGVTAGPDRNADSFSNYTLTHDFNQHRKWLQEHTILHFRDGQDHGFGVYDGTLDTHLGDGGGGVTLPGVAHGNADSIRVDGDGDREQGLLLFSGIVGLGPGQVPPGTAVQQAILTLTTEGPGAESLTGAKAHRMLVSWDQAATWDSLVDGVDLVAEAEPVHDADTGTLFSNKHTRSFDVTTSVQAWVDGQQNHGWAFLANGNNRWDFRSSDWHAFGERPMLTIIYR